MFSVSLWLTHHGDTENTEFAQRRSCSVANSLYIAVDLGAGSGRVFLAAFEDSGLLLEEVRRFRYPPARSAGHLRWDFPEIFAEIKQGLREAAARARELGSDIRSVGVDSWGVDYGLIDAAGNLVELPICYRDERTEGTMERVFARVPRAVIFERTGIQFMSFNTLFQLEAHMHEGLDARAHTLLLIPDLINFCLTGKRVAEYTNATTTQMVNPRTGKWDYELLNRLSLPVNVLRRSSRRVQTLVQSALSSASTRTWLLRQRTIPEVRLPARRSLKGGRTFLPVRGRW